MDGWMDSLITPINNSPSLPSAPHKPPSRPSTKASRSSTASRSTVANRWPSRGTGTRLRNSSPARTPRSPLPRERQSWSSWKQTLTTTGSTRSRPSMNLARPSRLLGLQLFVSSEFCSVSLSIPSVCCCCCRGEECMDEMMNEWWLSAWMSAWMKWWMNAWMKWWMTAWIKWWMSAWMKWWMSACMNEMMNECMNEILNECMNEMMNGLMRASVDKWMNELN